MECLDDNTATEFLQDLLSAERRAKVEQHIDQCDSCRVLLSNVVASTVDPGGKTGPTRLIDPGKTAAPGGIEAVACSGGRVADRYVLERELGRGGMGQVWRASDTKLRRPVAIKLMSSQLTTAGLSRFEREAMAIAQLRSPQVVEIYDYGNERGCPFIVMELLEGEDLRHRLTERTSLPLRQVAGIVIDAAKALNAAHDAGIVHRDLKPANIFICRHLGAEHVKVFDFGVAKMAHDVVPSAETTAEGVVVGTPRYMSPEQTHGSRPVDYRTDLWSLGVIAYRALTGRLPFEADGVGEVFAQILEKQPPVASELVDELPPAIDGFFERALAKDVERRFGSALAMATEIAQIAELTDPSLPVSSAVTPDGSQEKLERKTDEPSRGDSSTLVSSSGVSRRRIYIPVGAMLVALAAGIALWGQRAPTSPSPSATQGTGGVSVQSASAKLRSSVSNPITSQPLQSATTGTTAANSTDRSSSGGAKPTPGTSAPPVAARPPPRLPPSHPHPRTSSAPKSKPSATAITTSSPEPPDPLDGPW